MQQAVMLRVRFHNPYPQAGVSRMEARASRALSNPAQPVRLSPRELEVLRRVVDGKSTRQIAAELGIAFKTAACHRSNLMAKLDVHETASLVRRAIELRLVDV
jgi:DNA-binding NarL/FixJ family response regulator